MRSKLLIKASHHILFVLFACCSTAQIAYCQNGSPQPGVTLVDTTAKPKKDSTAQAGHKLHVVYENAGFKKDGNVQIKEIASAGMSETDTTEAKDSSSVADAASMPDPAPARKQDSNKEINTGNKEVVTRTYEAAPYEESVDPLISKYAEKIEQDVRDINNYPLYRFIDQWYGAPYKYGGTDINGIDCSAFSQKLYDKVYSTGIVRTAKQQRKSTEHIKDYDDAAEGDLVFFRIHHIRISHVGVYLANGYFVHASRSQGVVISNLNTPYWRHRYAGCGRVQKENKAILESDFSVSPTQ